MIYFVVKSKGFVAEPMYSKAELLSADFIAIKELLGMHCATLRGKMLRVVYHTNIQQNDGLFYTVLLARAANHRYSQQMNCVSEAWG